MNKTRPRIFYGWWVVAACFLCSMSVAGTISYGFTAFFEPIARDMGWSYTQISLAASMRGAEVGLMAPMLGILVDRWGPRRIMFTGGAVAGLGMILLSRTASLGMFYAAFFLISLGMSGCTSTVTMTAVANWFHRRASLATGIMTCGVGSGGLLVSVLVMLIGAFGWRNAMVAVGLGLWAVILPLSLVVRHKPEQYGLLPDGDVTPPVRGRALATREETAVRGVRQVVTSRSFLYISLAFFIGGGMTVSAVLTHVMPYLTTVGVDRPTAGLMATIIPVTSAVGRLGFGWIGDRIDLKRTTALSFALMSLGLVAFNYVAAGGAWLLLASVLIFGLGYGGNAIMVPLLIREYLGSNRFGTVLGFVLGWIMLGQILGPFLAGRGYDAWGSYFFVWFGLAALGMIGFLIILATPRIAARARQPRSAALQQ